MITVQLTSLKCIKPSGNTDEAYFEYKVDNSGNSLKVPNDPSVDNSWNISEDDTISFQPQSKLKNGTIIAGSELTFNFTNLLTLNLMDYDKGSGDDLLGSIKFDVNELPHSPFTMLGDDNDVIYQLTFNYL